MLATAANTANEGPGAFARPQGAARADRSRVDGRDRVRSCRTQRFILGPQVELLEKQIAEYSDCKFGIGVSSGTDALLVA